MRHRVIASVLETIGHTPLLTLSRLHTGPGTIYGKMELMQPGGSVKDRIALRIIQDAYKSGDLVEGQSVVEMTSGNTGAGLAVVCNVLKHPFTAVMSEGQSKERVKMLEALGAKVHLTPQVDGTPGQVTGNDLKQAEIAAEEYAKKIGAFFVDQFKRPGGESAHEEGTGPEIYEALHGDIDAFVATAGSAGTFVGVAKYLKSKNPKIFCAVVEPKGAEVLAGGDTSKPKHIIQGTGYNYVPPHWDPSVCDMYLAVDDDEVAGFTKEIALKEGIFVGYSSGANVCAALKLLKSGKIKEDAKIATILCDTGFKYSHL